MLLLLACAAPDPSPAADLVAAAGAIGYGARVATAAIAGEPGACAEVNVPCETDPCVVEVDVRVDEACPLPVAEHAAGVIPVAGTVAEDGGAILGASFEAVEAEGGDLRVRDISVFTVAPDDAGVTVAYAIEDVRVDDAETAESVEVEQSGFAATVDDAGTPGDPADDTITVSGGGQIVRGTEVWQVALSDVELSPACRRNPVSGFAVIEDVSEESGGITTYLFHAACDGTVDVAASAGVGVAWSGRSVGFDLLE